MDLEKSRRDARAKTARRLGRNLREMAEESQQGEREAVGKVLYHLAVPLLTGGFAGAVISSRWHVSRGSLSTLVLLVIIGVGAIQRYRRSGED